jgi:UDP-2-acetamido-3-amino-2,3-dideoxy-glucuronate N-acetyltransferase
MSAELQASGLAPGLLLGEGVEIADGVRLGGHVVIHAGARIGADALVGDHAQIRERAEIGAGAIVGSFACVDPEVSVGPRASVQTRCYLTTGSLVEEDAFLGPGVTLANDDTMGRHSPEEPLRGPVLRRACRMGAGAVICPGVEIGEEAFVGAGAVITADVAARDVVVGVPARKLREVPDEDLLERRR